MRARSLAFDLTITAVFAGVAFLEAATHADNGYRGTAAPLVGGLLAAAAVLPLGARRRAPIAVLAVICALGSLPHLLVSYDPVFLGGCVPVVVAAETVGRYGVRPAARWALLIPLPALVVLGVAVPGFAADAVVFAALLLGGWTLGVLVRALGERRRALAGELVARADAEALETSAAVIAERTRIARDLHDVIAHCVGVMVLQAGAGRLQLGRDSALTADAVDTIERVGREALVELQRVLGLLRGADGGGSVAALDPLLDDLRRAGLAVRLRVDGDPAALPPALDASLYRVVQESLTNALKHGGGQAVDVRLAVSGARVELEVVNAVGAASAALPGGHGQTGMRERVAAFGGAMTAGLDAGSYRVHAVVPVGEPA